MSDVKISSKKFIKINEYFYMTPEGDILKYKKYPPRHLFVFA